MKLLNPSITPVISSKCQWVMDSGLVNSRWGSHQCDLRWLHCYGEAAGLDNWFLTSLGVAWSTKGFFSSTAPLRCAAHFWARVNVRNSYSQRERTVTGIETQTLTGAQCSTTELFRYQEPRLSRVPSALLLSYPAIRNPDSRGCRGLYYWAIPQFPMSRLIFYHWRYHETVCFPCGGD